MGDKSPRAKARTQKQRDDVKAGDAAAARIKQDAHKTNVGVSKGKK